MKYLAKILMLISVMTMVVFAACIEQDPCDSIECLNDGICVDGTCICESGYSGKHCEIVDDNGNNNDNCTGVTCFNGGVCVNGNCECPPNYTGTNCQYEVDPCTGVSCVNGDLDSDCDCNCDDGWTGNDCDTPLPDSYTFIPGPLLDICPSHIGGNANFAGTARIDIDCSAFVLNDKDIFVGVRFHAKQINDDWTEGLYDGNIHIYSAPNGKKINRIVSATTSTGDYEDSDNERDIIYTTGLVNYFGVLGETSNDDFVDYRDCTADAETELNIYFNQMTIELVDE